MGYELSDGGKGDKARAVDLEKFDSNYDAIFGKKKVVRGSFVFDKEKNEFVPVDEFAPSQVNNGPIIMGDLQPYKSMVTGEMVMGRAQHREHLKKHNVIEVGNETKYISQRKQLQSPTGLKRTIADIVNSKL
jgi:hypothetical protein